MVMRIRLTAASVLFLLCAACGAVTSRTAIQTAPEVATACAGDLLASIGYDLLADEPVLRAERSKHAAAGRMRADYDRVTVAVERGELRVRGETVSVSGGGPALAMRGRVASSPGGATPTRPSKELRADVKRLAIECAGGS